MGTFIVEKGNGISFKFAGEELASVLGYYETSLFTKYSLYKTTDKKFVCQRIDVDPDKIKIDIVDTKNNVIDFFGIDVFTIKLFKKAGINIKE